MRSDLKVTPIESLPPETIRACYELVAQALRESSLQLMINLAGVKHGDVPVGDFEITVRRL